MTALPFLPYAPVCALVFALWCRSGWHAPQPQGRARARGGAAGGTHEVGSAPLLGQVSWILLGISVDPCLSTSAQVAAQPLGQGTGTSLGDDPGHRFHRGTGTVSRGCCWDAPPHRLCGWTRSAQAKGSGHSDAQWTRTWGHSPRMSLRHAPGWGSTCLGHLVHFALDNGHGPLVGEVCRPGG